MATPFLSSEEYDERAHQLYNEGQYDEALAVLREGLTLYPTAVELHIGVGYARLARDEFAWARRAFEEALVLEPEHEDALAGLGETLLRFGQRDAALKCFRRTLELGYGDDIDLMLQVGRALFRAMPDAAKEFFDVAVQHAPEMAEAVACVGYAEHRLGDDEAAIATLRRALRLDSEHAEARIYLANILYDRGDYEAALYHLERTTPEDHWDELAIWRLLELKKSMYQLADDDPDLRQWEERLQELAGEMDDIDEMLAEIEAKANEDAAEAEVARGQLELFGALLTDLADQRREPATHRVVTDEGRQFTGSWEDIVREMRDATGNPGRTLEDFMRTEARRGETMTGVKIPTRDCESFIRGIATAGLLRIVA
ncbi:MAG TPA: tetratricopeptide repeat protein [Gemmatimonadaceae bacterium]|nr:tetratricopeptide repeat protein [Gemmatimonadaceae bacterium]